MQLKYAFQAREIKETGQQVAADEQALCRPGSRNVPELMDVMDDV